MGKRVVVGCGNSLLKDEGFGIHVARELQRMELPKNVEVHDAGTGGLAILDLLEGAESAIIVDAMKLGLKPGTIKVFSLKNMPPPSAFSFSTHELDLVTTLRVGEELQRLPEKVEVIGVEAKEIKEFGTDLSKELENSKNKVIDLILKRLKKRF
jgi:hydrogenase maturation protease